jgi:hypothetical protein
MLGASGFAGRALGASVPSRVASRPFGKGIPFLALSRASRLLRSRPPRACKTSKHRFPAHPRSRAPSRGASADFARRLLALATAVLGEGQRHARFAGREVGQHGGRIRLSERPV